MVLVETALIKSTLLEWFNKKTQHLELDLLIKHKYEKKIQLIGKELNVSYEKCR